MKNLFRMYVVLAYRIIRNIIGFFQITIRFIQRQVPKNLACYIQNCILTFRGSNVSYGFDKYENLFYAKEKCLKWFFGDLDRGFKFYDHGILKRGDNLATSYCITDIKFDNTDIVVDCGANYGDLFIFLSDKIIESNYIAIEPGPIEYKTLLRNIPNAKVFNNALSNIEGEFDFYLCSKTGESSLVRPKNFTNIIKAKVRTLDEILKELKISKCRLFKLEAEGWEPEILNGAVEFIRICDYIAVDGGKERGVKADSTLHIINNFLLKSGFEMIGIEGKQYRALYKRII